MKLIKKLLLILAVIAVVLGTAGFFYVNDYYHASEDVRETIRNSAVDIVQEDRDIRFIPDEPEAVLVFHPGGKVEYTAYAPLMEKLAERERCRKELKYLKEQETLIRKEVKKAGRNVAEEKI